MFVSSFLSKETWEGQSEMALPKKQEIMLSELERKTLVELAKSRITPHGLVLRSTIVLASADGGRQLQLLDGLVYRCRR